MSQRGSPTQWLRSSIRVSPDFDLARHKLSYALATPHEAKRRGCAKRIPPQTDKPPFAFTAPLSLVHPMARAHVKLLGPCFKTGRTGRRTTRNRDATRTSMDARYTRPLNYPSPPKPGTRGSRVRRPENFTPALGPARTVRCVRRQWSAAANSPDLNAKSLRISNAQADKSSA